MILESLKMFYKNKLVLIFFLIVFDLILLSPIFAKIDEPVTLSKVETTTNPSYELIVNLNLKIKDGWHINGNNPAQEFLIPTSASFDKCKILSDSVIIYPQPEIKFIKYLNEKMALFKGDILIRVQSKLETDLKKYECKIKINYQACNDAVCLPPSFFIANVGKNIEKVDKPIVKANGGINDKISELFNKKNYFFAFLLVFIIGLSLNLTPCIFPLIPITVSFFINQSQYKTLKILVLSLAYSLGLVSIYSSLGLIASITGGFFGGLLQNGYVITIIAFFLIVLSLSMFGFYEFKLPTNLLSQKKYKSNLVSAFVTGATAGLIAAPCIGPFLLGLLTYVGILQNKFLGFSIFFVLSLGLGLPYIFLALFSNWLKYLPKSGYWLEMVRKLFGVLLILMALYMLKPLIGSFVFQFFSLGTIVVFLFYIAFAEKAENISKYILYLKRVLAFIILIFVIYAFANLNAKRSEGWEDYKPGILTTLKNQPAIIDFYASWCMPCRKLDYVTFSDESVISELTRFRKIKVDLTISNKEKDEFARSLNVRGVPTVIFIDSNEKIIDEKNIYGFVSPQEMLGVLKSVK